VPIDAKEMAKTTKRTSPSDFHKNKPTIFPMGFITATVEDGEIIVVEFLDEIGGQRTIIESIALPKSKALQLSMALKSAVEEDNEIAEEEK
jgi:hypothetical protein